MLQQFEIQQIQQEGYQEIKENTKKCYIQPENMLNMLIHPGCRFAEEEHNQERHVHQQTNSQSQQKCCPAIKRGFLHS
jgi:hypothetical protein